MWSLRCNTVFAGCFLLLCQLSAPTDGQFFTRFASRNVQGPRLQVIDSLVRGRGLYEHFALPPQRNVSGPVRVLFSLGLIRIVDFDEQNMILTFVALERYNWMDLSMTYVDNDKSPLVLPKNGIWLPDLKVIGSLTPRMDYDESARPLVYTTGEIMYLPKVKHVIGCVTSSSREYVCSLKYNSWHYSGNQPDFYGRQAGWDMAHALEHPVWRVTGHDARRNVKRYAENRDVFVDLTYTLRLRRK